MPFVVEQKRTLGQTQEKRPVAQQRTSARRLSAIPRPVKQLVLEPTTSGISHASKPTLDRLPVRTPSKNLNSAKPNDQDGNSKPKTTASDSKTELAVLELEPFSRQPVVNFDEVKLGTTEIRYVVLRNSLDVQQQLFVISFPKADKGFYIDATEFLIAPNTEICVALAWTPRFVGGIRESITLQDINRMPRRIVVMGTAVRPRPVPSQQKSSARKIPRLFRRSPIKINRQMRQERNKLVFSPRATQPKHDKKVKPLTKLISPSPQKRHQLVRKLLSQYDEQMATKIQSYFRMLIQIRRFKDLRMAIKVQSYFRMVIQMRRLKDHGVVTKIQSYFRMLIQIRRLKNLRMAIKVQSYVRMVQEQQRFKIRKEEVRLERLNLLVLWFQSRSRGHLCRRRLMNERMAIKVQSYFRMVIQMRKLEDHEKATKIQSYFRMLIQMRILEDHKMATKIQSYFRMLIQMRELVDYEKATKIQSYFRMVIQIRNLRRMKILVIWFQSRSRGHLYRRKLKSSIDAMLKIQRRFCDIDRLPNLMLMGSATALAHSELSHYRASQGALAPGVFGEL